MRIHFTVWLAVGLLALLAVPELTRTHEGTVATGNEGSDYFYVVARAPLHKWHKDQFPLKVFIPPDSEAAKMSGYTADCGNALRQAFANWQADSKGLVSFQFVDKPSLSDIECEWMNDGQTVGTDKFGESALIPQEQHGIKHADIKIWLPEIIKARKTGFAQAIDRTALHEIGHCLGLHGHSAVTDDMMYSTIAPMQTSPRPSKRDLNTLKRLYSQDALSTNELSANLEKEAHDLAAAGHYDAACSVLEKAERLLFGVNAAQETAVLREMASCYQAAGNAHEAAHALRRLLLIYRRTGKIKLANATSAWLTELEPGAEP